MDRPLTTPEKAGLHLIGKAIAEHREGLLRLLRRRGWQFPADVPAKTLVAVILDSLEKDGERFHRELAHLLGSHDNFTGEAPQISVGADPVSAIAGAVGSVASLVGSAVNKKAMKRAAQAATVQALLQAEPRPTEVEQPPRKEPTKPRRKFPVWLGVVLGVVGLAGIGLLIFSLSQPKPAIV